MGNLMQRNNEGVEEVDIASNNAYRFPPKTGSYFGSHFIMGGVRFDTIQPEAFLFGENNDLNFLGNRPIPFPYPAPQPGEPTKTLKSLVNIRKDSLRLVKVSEVDSNPVVESESATVVSDKANVELEKNDNTSTSDSLTSVETIEETETADVKENRQNDEEGPADDTESTDDTKYNVEFTFDCDVRCAVTVYYFATEELLNGHAVYHPRNSSMNSETYHYKKGANQTFNQSSHIIQPGLFPEDDWQFSVDKETIPLVIQCVVEDEDHIGHSHMTFGCIEKTSEGFTLKPLKQKQMVDGLCYLLQEIYGIENKLPDSNKTQQEDDYDEMGSECVICMCDIRDTLILPCRHMCLCNGCADSLRYQANNCPICRSPFRALLQVRAMRKKLPNAPEPAESDEPAVSQEGVPPGYEAVTLIEALNGPLVQSPLMEGNRRPVSPTGSPHVERRRSAKRISSAGTTSLRGSIVHEECETTRVATEVGAVEDGRGTPEVVMSGQQMEPVKDSKDNNNHGRRSSAKKRSPVKGEQVDVVTDSVEVVNETVETDKVEDGVALGAEAACDRPVVEVSHHTDEQCMVDAPEEDEDAVKPIPPLSNVIFDSKEEREDTHDLDVTVNPLMPDPISLPGTPITDGSSFNSTCSTTALLPHPYNQSKNQDDDAIV